MTEVGRGEISGGEVSSSEVSGGSSAASGGDISTSEVREAEGTSEEEVDKELSAELDDSYSSYIKEGKMGDFEKKESSVETDEAAAPEKFEAESDDLDAELDRKYNEKMDERNEKSDAADGGHSELSEADKAKLKEETGWSDEIVDSTKSLEEAEIYKKAGLKEEEIDGRKCLIRQDIDMEQKDEFGRTNKERMANGNPPLTQSGETVELHHIGQKQDSPLAELTTQEHRGKGNDTVLHDKQKESEIDRTEFAKERKQHWESRFENC